MQRWWGPSIAEQHAKGVSKHPCAKLLRCDRLYVEHILKGDFVEGLQDSIFQGILFS